MNWLAKAVRRLAGAGEPDPALRPPSSPCEPCAQKAGVRQFALDQAAPTIADSDVPRLPDELSFAMVDGALVLYQPLLGVSHVLNATAALIWTAVGDGLTVERIIDELTESAGIPRVIIATDVRAALAQFVASGIVTFGGDAPLPAPAPESSWNEAKRRMLGTKTWPTRLGPVRAAAAEAIVRTNGEAISDQLHDALSALPPATGSVPQPTEIAVLDRGTVGPRRYRMYVDGERRSAVSTPDSIMTTLIGELNSIATDASNGRLILHAGAVERGGFVVVIAGNSGRGKSTLTASLAQRGFAYLTDEVVAIDPERLEVLPYPKPLSLDADALGLLGLDGPDLLHGTKAHVSPDRFGSVSSGGRVVLIVLLEDEAAAAGRAVYPSERVATLIDLLGCTFSSSFEDPDALDALAAIADRVPLMRLERCDLDEACARIEARLVAEAPDAALPRVP